jgi:6-phosphogluconolactonase
MVSTLVSYPEGSPMNPPTPPQVRTFDTLPALVLAAADHIITLAQDAVQQRGRFSIALSGGSTPKPVYEALAAQKDRLDWTKIHIFWSDERCVPPNHPDSNYHMAHAALLRHIEHECGNIHRMRGEIDPQTAAQQYEAALKASFGDRDSTDPQFDLILLGMGDDGHTASLFPHTAALNETERLVVANHVEKLGVWRLTFTVPLINAAHNVTFLVSGENKAVPLYEVLHGAYQPDLYPSQLIRPTQGNLRFMVDTPAASRLP